jgi:hypothetical protein
MPGPDCTPFLVSSRGAADFCSSSTDGFASVESLCVTFTVIAA